MPVEWALNIALPIFKRKGDIRNCSCYRTVNLLEHRMKVVKSVFEKRFCRIATINVMQFGFMHEKGSIDAILIMRRVSC